MSSCPANCEKSTVHDSIFILTPSGAIGSKERTVQKRFRINFQMPSGKLAQLVKTPVLIAKSSTSGQFLIAIMLVPNAVPGPLVTKHIFLPVWFWGGS